MALGLIAAGPWDESSLRDIRDDSIDRQIGFYIDRDDMVSTVMSTLRQPDGPLRPLPRPQVRPDLAGGVLRPAGRLRRRRPGRAGLRSRPAGRPPAPVARGEEAGPERPRSRRSWPACSTPLCSRRSPRWEAEIKADPRRLVGACEPRRLRPHTARRLSRQPDGSVLAQGPSRPKRRTRSPLDRSWRRSRPSGSKSCPTTACPARARAATTTATCT